jgi:hypothetical protein
MSLTRNMMKYASWISSDSGWSMLKIQTAARLASRGLAKNKKFVRFKKK